MVYIGAVEMQTGIISVIKDNFLEAAAIHTMLPWMKCIHQEIHKFL